MSLKGSWSSVPNFLNWPVQVTLISHAFSAIVSINKMVIIAHKPILKNDKRLSVTSLIIMMQCHLNEYMGCSHYRLPLPLLVPLKCFEATGI